MTKDVPAYGVVGGNPAKFIKNRFNENLTKILTDLKWWDLPVEEITKILPLLYNEDLQTVEKELHKLLCAKENIKV